MNPGSRQTNFTFLIVAILALAFHCATISSYHSWGDDFAQYILHARNIVNGTQYDKTGYIQNPVDVAQLVVGPRAFPPLTAIVLSPVYRFFGPSLVAMKALQALLLVLAAGLAAATAVTANRIDRRLATAFMAVLAFHPLLWEAKEYVGSDLLFLATLYGALLVIERIVATPAMARLEWRGWLGALSLGALLYGCIAARTVGIVMIPVVLGVALLERRHAKILLPALAVCGILMVVQSFWLPSDSSYVRFLATQTSLRTSLNNARDYFKVFSGVWKLSTPLLAQGLYLLTLPLVALGGFGLLRRRITALDLFALGYIIVLVVWPGFGGVRYLLPLLPVYVLYLLDGASRINRSGAVITGTALLMISAGNYILRAEPPADSGVTQPAFLDLSDAIQRISRPDDHFLFRKPRALALFANRPTAPYNSKRDDALTWKLIDQLNIRYIVKSNFSTQDFEADLSSQDFETDRTLLTPFLNANPRAFELVYANSRFALYEVHQTLPKLIDSQEK